MRYRCERVLGLTRDGAGRVTLGTKTHQTTIKGAPQSVGDDRILQFGVAIAESASGAIRDVGGIAHRLHTPGHHNVGLS